jgi:hypothetical protein
MHAAKTARLASPEACKAQPLMSALMPVACGAGASRRNDERQGQWDHHEARVERGKPHCGLHEQRDEKIERDVAEKETERRDEPADKGAIRQQCRFD